MGIEEIVKLAMDNSFSVVLLAWMIYKDYKFNENILGVLGEVREVLAALKAWHEAEERGEKE